MLLEDRNDFFGGRDLGGDTFGSSYLFDCLILYCTENPCSWHLDLEREEQSLDTAH